MLEARAFFLSWQDARLASPDLKPMGPAGLKQAELVWRHWLAFCTARDVVWFAAQSSDIEGFLSGIGPRATRSILKKTSPVTQRRYWRVLRDFYTFAVASEIIDSNPADAAQPRATERVPSMALSHNMWLALHDGLPSGDSYKDRRNRLVLLLMMRAALTVQEIIGLSMDSVEVLNGPLDTQAAQIKHAGLPLFQPDPALQAQAHYSGVQPAYLLRVRRGRTGPERVLLLDARTSQAMADWLELRVADVAPAGQKNRLSHMSRLIVGDRIGKTIAPHGLYNICQAHLVSCLVERGFLSAPEPHVVHDPGGLNHLGPNTLRNTCIALWFNAGVPLEEIQRRCGFKDASVMSRLGAHLVSPFPT